MPKIPEGLLCHYAGEGRDASGTFSCLEMASVYNGNAGGVVASILKASQSVE
jgi:hypothetical protein